MLQDLARRTIGWRQRSVSTDRWTRLTHRLLDGWQRHRARRALLELDDRLLRDIGITRDAARSEARRCSWR